VPFDREMDLGNEQAEVEGHESAQEEKLEAPVEQHSENDNGMEPETEAVVTTAMMMKTKTSTRVRKTTAKAEEMDVDAAPATATTTKSGRRTLKATTPTPAVDDTTLQTTDAGLGLGRVKEDGDTEMKIGMKGGSGTRRI